MKWVYVFSIIIFSIVIVSFFHVKESYTVSPEERQRIIQLFRIRLKNAHNSLLKTTKHKKGLYYSNKSKEYDLCRKIYDPEIRKREISIIPRILTKDECDIIVKEGEEYANANKWTTDRHDSYPTTDNEITKQWYSYNKIVYSIHNKIIPEIVKLFKVNPEIIGINEIFISKYSDGGQTYLKPHRDGSEFSFIISLNSDFTGGGTEFINLNKHVLLKTGDCLVFSGQEKHKGVKIKSGTRYIIAGFLGIIKEDEFCENWAKVYTNLSESESEDD